VTVSLLSLQNRNWEPEPNYSASIYPTGLGAEIRIATFLWDLWDTNSDTNSEILNPDNRTKNTENVSLDPVNPTGSAQQRYRTIATYFLNGSVNWGLKDFWLSKIKPTLSGQNLKDHCTVLRYNTLGAADSSCP
jgi:hypothetical protein